MKIWVGLIFVNILSLQVKAKVNVSSTNRCLQFEVNLTWKETLAKAKAEHKYIFVDCYATWCGPCKKMDKDVYPDPKVGEYFNQHFISFKLQFDTSAADDALVKSRYADAKKLNEQFKIDAYPTFLFFTPDGKLLNRQKGARDAAEFVEMAKLVLDPAYDYYGILEIYNKGKADVAQTGFLARQAMVLGDTAKSLEIAKSYISHLRKDSLYTKSNLGFMKEFTKTSSDPGFPLFYNHPDTIDLIMRDDTYARDAVQGVIYSEFIVPAFNAANKSGSTPDWDKLAVQIEKKYNVYYAKRLVVAARSTWANRHNNMPEYTHYLVEFQENYGSKTNTGESASMTLNNYAWAIFLYSNNSEELKKALGWSGRAVLMAPDFTNWMDTYANILYKLKRSDLAIKWEQTILKLEPNKETQAIIDKMKKGEPTWPPPDKP